MRCNLLFCLHLSFILVIAGGILTFLTGRSGTIHLSKEGYSDSYITSKNERVDLPFRIRLINFHTEYYPGMNFPKDFISEIRIENDTLSGRDDKEKYLRISMNRIGKYKGYRFYQSSFDRAGGTILTISHDPWGMSTTYTGYMLFILSGGLLLMKRILPMKISGTVFHSLNGRYVIPLLMVFCNEAFATPAVEKNSVDSIRMKEVSFNGRSVTMERLCSELTMKITGENSVGKLDATQFVTSLLIYPEEWSKVPFISIKRSELKDIFPDNNDFLAVCDLYKPDKDIENSGYRYIPDCYYQDGNGKYDRDLLKLDEKVALIISLWKGELFNPPEKGMQRSGFIRGAEVLYFKYQPVRWLFIVTFITVIILIPAIWIMGRRPERISSFILMLIYVTVYLWRWCIDGRIPLAGSGDIMFFSAVIIVILSFIISLRHNVPSLIILFAGGLTTLVAWLSYKDPVMTPLMPVLASPWLTAHVSVIMISYSLLGLSSLLALSGLIGRYLKLSKFNHILVDNMSYSLLRPGVYLTGVGIILGSMWANVSWGRYWDWDPKETWALITMLLYAVPLHRGLGFRPGKRSSSIFISLAFLSILMTYTGVNYLSSIHSYR